MRLLKYIVKTFAFSLVWLVILLLFTGVAAKIKEPSFVTVEPHQLPEYFPLAVYWIDDHGTPQCRAIWHFQLSQFQGSVINTRLSLPSEANEECRRSGEYLQQNKQWPVMFNWDRTIHWPYATIRLDSDQVFVAYSLDDDLINQGRYRVRDGMIHSAEYLTYSGPGQALRAMPYGLSLTVVLWIAHRYLRRRWRKRKL